MARTADDVNPLESWHLDKKIPIAIILALALHAAAGIWFASKMDSRLTAVEARTAIIEATKVGESLAALKTSQDDMRRSLDRIERTIDGQRSK